MTDDVKTDPATIRQLREARAWSQEQLAAIAGVSARTVQRVESDGAASLETRMALAMAFGCQPADLSPNAAPAGAANSLAAVNQPANDRSMVIVKVLYLAAAVLLCLLYFGYRVGQDLAERDNRIECPKKHGVECRMQAKR